MFKSLCGRGRVADRAFGNCAGVTLAFNRLKIVHKGHCRSHGVWTAVACRTMDIAMSVGLLKEFAGLFEIKLFLLRGMATATGGFVDPRRPQGISHGRHIAMALDAVDALAKMDVALAIGLETGMTRITLVGQTHCRQWQHAVGMRTVHGVRKSLDPRHSGSA